MSGFLFFVNSAGVAAPVLILRIGFPWIVTFRTDEQIFPGLDIGQILVFSPPLQPIKVDYTEHEAFATPNTHSVTLIVGQDVEHVPVKVLSGEADRD